MKIVSHKIGWSAGDLFDSIRVAIANVRLNQADCIANLEGSPNRSLDRFQRLNRLINHICKADCHLAVFPEIYVPHYWLRWLSWVCAQKEIGLVVGLEHKIHGGQALNYIATLLPYRNRGKYKSCYVSKRLKRYYAPGEVAEIEGRFLNVPPEASQAYDLFRWRGATFTVFNCFELTNISERSWFRGKVDFLVCSEVNTDTNYFSNIVESSARDLHCYVVQTNDATFGDSRIVAPSKTEQMNLIRVKGGENETFLWTTLELNKLRQHQNKAHSLQTRKDAPFKATPAGWNRNLLTGRLHKPRRTR